MKVRTQSAAAREAQQGTMEFLLINHPLDCPICDQGGECELQDVAMGYGGDLSRYVERKRVVVDQDIGPLIATDMTRCIHCTRCVRFGAEIAGVRELGAIGRGEHMRIGTYIEHSVSSELSGNVIDLCPVGALTSKPYRYTARAWEMIQRDAIAPHDCVGSNLHLHVKGNRVMRVHPAENEAVNECWISDRDRFSYQGLYSEDRLHKPLIRKDGNWQEAEWADALEFAAQGLRAVTAVLPEQLATLISPNATLEELYLAQKPQKVSSALVSPHIDLRLRQSDFSGDETAASLPWLGLTIAGLEALGAALLIGSTVRKDQPLLGHRLRKAALNGAHIHFVNPLRLDLNHEAGQMVSSPGGMVGNLAALAKALGVVGKGAAKKLIAAAEPGDAAQRLADKLKSAENAAVLLGNLALSHPDYAVLRDLAAAIAKASDARLGYLPEAANSVGARLAGALPHGGPGLEGAGSKGLDTRALLSSRRKGYLLFGIEPAYDFWDPTLTQKELEAADFVVALTGYRSPSLESCAHVLLPIAGYPETSGTFVNAEGNWQSFRGAVAPQGEARPGWKVLRVLGNRLDLEGFDYLSSEDIRNELQPLCGELTADNLLMGADAKVQGKDGALTRIGEVPIYAADALVRRASALQQTRDGSAAGIWLNAKTAEKTGLTGAEQASLVQDGNRVTLPLSVDPRVPDDCARVPAGVTGTESLGGQFGEVKLEKA
jgi:NADH-quinone oxidoreductase subunit G